MGRTRSCGTVRCRLTWTESWILSGFMVSYLILAVVGAIYHITAFLKAQRHPETRLYHRELHDSSFPLRYINVIAQISASDEKEDPYCDIIGGLHSAYTFGYGTASRVDAHVN